MINFPAPAEPPMRATIKLGIIAKHLVKKFLSHGLIVKLRNPCITYCPAYVPVIVEL